MILSIRIRDWLLKEMESYQFKSFKYKFQMCVCLSLLYVFSMISFFYITNTSVNMFSGEGKRGCDEHACLSATWICFRSFRDAICSVFSRSNMSGKLLFLYVVNIYLSNQTGPK
ncbi:hypothetical protein ACS0TY_004574 [Phlomoides rotata]